MRALVAPDKFKGSLTAAHVADALALGLATAGVQAETLPLADGGDGSVAAAVAAGFTAIPVQVVDALGAPRESRIALCGDDAVARTTAVVEVADTCGLATLPAGVRDPLGASSLGFGRAVAAAIDAGATRVVLALGGSASTDAGLGLLSALGYRLLAADGEALPACGASLGSIAEVPAGPDLTGVEFVVAGDVLNPLTGPGGTAAVYGPQKGATSEQVERLDAGMHSLVRALEPTFPRAAELAAAPGAGAAGGLGFAALLLGARMTSGAEFFLDLLGFDERAAGADLVVTGEGSVDDQTGHGKLLSVLAARATVPVSVAAGRCTLPESDWADAGFARVYVLSEYTDGDTEHDPQLTYEVLKRIGLDIGAELTG
ncbi:glycerate kinase [Tsukamurella sp. 8F]|nr:MULTISPECIES: glycerate kinase [unclassified Tsukamurella]MDF0528329.1 glycerate kinase [Tsukamurella sp. 8J]MDF0586154.1 glycerate kinase [Tsukamurella sp. 8F]